jgi:hypothetical protein
MLVTINEQNLPVDFSHFQSLEDIIAEIHARFIPSGQQLFQVRVNGEFFSERYPRESRYINIKEIAELDVRTVSDAEMARYILQDSARQGGTLLQAIEQSAFLFRVGSEEEANHYFAQVLEALRWLLQTGGNACQVLQVDLTGISSGQAVPIPRYFQDLQDLLDEMLEISEAGDYVMLADLLEYELLPMVREWQRILQEIACR